MKALKLLKILRDDYIHGELDEAINEAINELEEAIKPKTCEKCKNFEFDQEFNDGYGQCFFGIHFPNSQSISYHKFDDGYCSLFEPKEK